MSNGETAKRRRRDVNSLVTPKCAYMSWCTPTLAWRLLADRASKVVHSDVQIFSRHPLQTFSTPMWHGPHKVWPRRFWLNALPFGKKGSSGLCVFQRYVMETSNVYSSGMFGLSQETFFCEGKGDVCSSVISLKFKLVDFV